MEGGMPMLIEAICLHLIADWIFQNDWMAKNKGSLAHPAAWVHGGIHFLAMLILFAPMVAGAIALVHMLIDTRKPLGGWSKFYRQTTEGEYAIHVSIWLDQVAHIVVLYLAVKIIELLGRA